jgi:hypothetical protein
MAKKAEAPDKDGVVTGEKTPPTAARLLKAGTVLHMGQAEVRLESDEALFMFNNAEIADDTLAGVLALSGHDNFRLNSGLFGKKRYNPSTGARVPNECSSCGKAIADEAEICDDCTALAEAEKKKKK